MIEPQRTPEVDEPSRDAEPHQRREAGRVSANQLVSATLKIYEQTQLQAAFSYVLRRKDPRKRLYLPKEFQVDTYFIFSPRMQVTRASYPIEVFYRDLKTFIRFREPRLSFKEMVGKDDKAARSPIRLICDYLEAAIAGQHLDRPPEAVIEEARVFGCSYFSYINRRTERAKHQFETWLSAFQDVAQPGDDADVLKNIQRSEKTLLRAYWILKEWRGLVERAKALPPDYLTSLREELSKVDEYCTYIFREGLLLSLDLVEKTRELGDTQLFASLDRRIHALLRLERWYARRTGFYWLEASSHEIEREGYLFRRSLLKRRMWSSLYLNTRVRPLFSIQRQIGAMVAAAMAGAWAVSLEVFIRLNTNFNNNPSAFIGVSGFALISAFTLIYVLKDRIKELGRGYFKSGIFRNVPDTSNRIFFRTEQADSPVLPVGVLQESSQYVELSKLPGDVHALMDTFDEELGEDEAGRKKVIHYRKRFLLDKSLVTLKSRKIKMVRDIFRLNINSLLAPLDAPMQTFLVLDGKGVRNIPSPKVYHIDLVLKMQAQVPRGIEVYPEYRYYRLVLNKEGLKRIERFV